MKILIKNGRLIDPATGRDEPGDVAIANGRILTLGQVSADFAPQRVIDATGCVVAPGLVDLAARLREPGHELLPALVVDVGHGDDGAARHRHRRGGGTDPPAAAGDDEAKSLERHR